MRSVSEIVAELRAPLKEEPNIVVVELSFGEDTSARDAARPTHKIRIWKLYDSGALLFAGPWRDDSGALLVFNMPESEVHQELKSDPYYTLPGVNIVQVRPWYPH